MTQTPLTTQAPFISDDLRVLRTFTTRETRFDHGMWRSCDITYSECQELINDRWEGFVSIESVEWV